VKYLIEGFAVALAAYYIPNNKMKFKAVAVIATTAAATFAVLDLFAPKISKSARDGTGYGIGLGLTGTTF